MTSGASVTKAAEAATVREKLNSSAYSYYGSAMAEPTGDKAQANGLKRIFAAALLSTTSVMAFGAAGAAADPAACSTTGPSTYTCSGTSTEPYAFSGDDIVVTGDATWDQDTTGVAATEGANTAISVTGENISAQNYGTIVTGADAYGHHHGLEVLSTTGWSYALNNASGSITTTASNSNALDAESGNGNAIAANDGMLKGYGSFSKGMHSNATGSGNATAVNRAGGSIVMSGDFQTGLEARSDGGTATGTNHASIHVTSDDSNGTGMTVRGSTVHATNNGTITVEATEYATGINAISSSPTTTNVVNNGTITVTSEEGYSTGIFADGPTIYVTNSEGATISSDYAAIAIGYAQGGEIVNSGDITGHILSTSGRKRIRLGANDVTIENTGTIDGMIDFRFANNTHVINDGGTVGDGTNAISVGHGESVVDIIGSGNDINGALVALDEIDEPDAIGPDVIIPLGASPEIHSTLNFSQDDTLTLDKGAEHVSIAYFDEINFNKGTTVFDGTNVWSPNGEANINASATVTTSSDMLILAVAQLTMSGKDATRGTLRAAANSTIQVTGDVVFDAGGRFTVGVAGDGEAGKLVANGSVTFEEGSEIYADLTKDLDLTPGGELLVVDGKGGLTDNGLGIYDNSILYDFTADQRDTKLYLLVERMMTALGATNNNNGRSNAQSIADAIDKFLEGAPTDNPIVQYLSQFPVEEQEAQLYKLVQDSLPSEANADGSSTVVTSDMVLDLIMDRLNASGFGVADLGSGETGLSAGDTMLGGDYKLALWGRIGGAKAEYTPSNINGFDSDTFAATMGIDGEFMPDFRAGIAVFYTTSDIDENGAGANSSQTIDSYGALLYGTYKPEDYYVTGTLGFGLNKYDSTRLALGGANVAEYDGAQFMARVEGGKIFDFGQWEVTPQAGLRLNHVTIDGYTETGPLPTTVNGQDITSVRGMAGVGLRYEADLGGGAKIIPEAYLRGLQELADPNEAITGSIVGGGSFVSQSEERDRFSLAAGAGLTYEVDEQLSLRVLYDGEFQSDYQEHALTAAIRFEF